MDSEPGTQNFRIAAIAAAVFLTATAAGYRSGAKSELPTAKLHSEFEESEEFCEFSAVHSLKSAVWICLAVVVFAVCESIKTLLDVLVYSATDAWSQQLTAHYHPTCRLHIDAKQSVKFANETRYSHGEVAVLRLVTNKRHKKES